MTENTTAEAELNRELQKVQQQIAALERAIDIEPDFGLGRGDPTITRREMDRALLDRLRERQETLENALSRVDQGTHGVCAQCSSAIHPDRLAILPSTRVCVHCAQNGQNG